MIPILGKIADSLGLSFLNRKDSPSSKAKVSDSPNSPLIQAGNVEGGVHQTTVYGQIHHTRPSLYIRNDGGSGGPDGDTIVFVVRNDGQESARNIKSQFKDGERLIHEETISGLTTIETSHITYDYTNTVFSRKKLSDPKYVLIYSSVDGRKFMSGVQLLQEERDDGNYSLSTKLGDSFDQTL